MARSRVPALVAVALAIAALSACGSTVAVSTGQGNRTLSASSGDGSGLDLTLNESTDSPTPSGAADGGTSSAGDGSATTTSSPTADSSSGSTNGSGAGESGTSSASSVASGAKEPILVGITFTDTKQADTFTGAFGSGLDTGDRKAQSELRIADINARGGINGHKLVAVFHQIDVNASRAVSQAAACADFTQDHHVKFVIIAELNDPSYFDCLTKHGAAAIDPTYARLSQPDFVQYPHLFYPAGIALDRLAEVEAERFVATQWIGPKDKIGIVYYDEPRFIRGEKALAAALRKRGIKVVQESAIHYPQSTGEAGQSLSDGQSVELRWRAAGVTHGLGVDDGVALGGVAIAAQSQGYDLKLGLNSGYSVISSTALLSADTLSGSQFIGWYPALDVANPKQQPATTTACFDFMRKRGQPVDTGNRKLTAISVCESLDFLVAGLKASAAFTPAGFTAGALSLKGSYVPSGTFELALTNRQHDGVGIVRDGRWNGSCKCFEYFGPLTKV